MSCGVPIRLAWSDGAGDAPVMLCWGENGLGEAVLTRWVAEVGGAKPMFCMVGEGVALLEVCRC